MVFTRLGCTRNEDVHAVFHRRVQQERRAGLSEFMHTSQAGDGQRTTNYGY